MFPLHAIVDVDAAAHAGLAPIDLAVAFLDGGARFLQVRAKSLDSTAFLSLCDAVVDASRALNASVIVNDRVDLALMSGAAGAHVGQEDLPPADARRLLGSSALIGVSTHTLAQVERALREPVTYIAVGPVFGTGTKDTGYDPVGLDFVRAARRMVPRSMPLVAIGGITLDTARSVLDAGASQVAVIGDLLATRDPRERVGAYCRALL